MFFESSLDILYVVLALCVIWFTVFLCWLLYQAARVLKNANDIIENVQTKLEIISDAVEFMRSKVDTVSGHMGIISRLVSTVVEKIIVGKMSKSFDIDLDEDDAPKKKKKK